MLAKYAFVQSNFGVMPQEGSPSHLPQIERLRKRTHGDMAFAPPTGTAKLDHFAQDLLPTLCEAVSGSRNSNPMPMLSARHPSTGACSTAWRWWKLRFLALFWPCDHIRSFSPHFSSHIARKALAKLFTFHYYHVLLFLYGDGSDLWFIHQLKFNILLLEAIQHRAMLDRDDEQFTQSEYAFASMARALHA
eukprot:m.371854 g.371854  ORF g.371854 m.371854 type:complete len:191 (-) comp60149_c0_seq1:7-579(-)